MRGYKKKTDSSMKEVRTLKNEKNRISSADSARVSKNKYLILEKISEVEATNRALKRIMHELHQSDAVLAEQKYVLLKKLSESERKYERVYIEIEDRDRQISALREEAVVQLGLQNSIEQKRAHLQNQLIQKEADCNRMAVQVRTVESSRAQDKIEIEHLTEMLAKANERAERDQ